LALGHDPPQHLSPGWERYRLRHLLYRDAGWRCTPRHRLHAPAARRGRERQTIMTQRIRTIRMPDHAGQRIQVFCKPIYSLRYHVEPACSVDVSPGDSLIPNNKWLTI
jgi:hypothetical protein